MQAANIQLLHKNLRSTCYLLVRGFQSSKAKVSFLYVIWLA